MTGHSNEHSSVPLAWRWARLGDHVSKVGSGVTPTGGRSVYRSSGIPLIRSQNVLMNRFEREGLAYISEDQDAEMWGSRVQPGDVLLNITGASIGRVCVAPSEICPANVNQHVCIVRTDGSIIPEFLALYLATPRFQQFIADSQAGATRQALTKSLIEDFRVPLPPAPEQERIARRLRNQLAEVGRGRAAVVAQLEAARNLRLAILRTAFEQASAGDWPTRPIEDFAETCSGATPSRAVRSYYAGKIPWVKTGELLDGVIADTEEHVSEDALRQTSLRLLPPKTVLVAMYGQGQTRGRTGLLAIPATTNQACFAILPNGSFLPEYLQYWFCHNYERLRRETESRGGNQPNLNGVLLRRLQVAMPPVDVQEGLVKRVASELAAASSVRRALETRLALFDKLTTSVLSEPFGTVTE